MKKSAPNSKVEGAVGKKSGCTSLLPNNQTKVNHEELLLLFDVHGRYPIGAAWRHLVTATSARAVLDLFEDDGLTGIKLVASTGGTSNRGQQNSGATTLLLLGAIGEDGAGDE